MLFPPADLTSNNCVGNGYCQSVCPGEEVIFTCDVIGSGRLTWTINYTKVIFSVRNSTNETEMTEYFQATLTNTTQDMNYSFLGNLSSELLVIASSNWIVNKIVIQCNDGITEQKPPSFELTLAGETIILLCIHSGARCICTTTFKLV